MSGPKVDPWHYPRPELADKYLDRFNPGPAEALILFAERRSGKTAFARNDLAPRALARGLQPVLIDLWSNRADPGLALADGLEAAARSVQNPDYKYGKLLGSAEKAAQNITSVGAFGVSVGIKRKEDSPAPTETLARINYWADQLVNSSKRPIVLILDEAQSIASAENGINIASALRATLQKHGRQKIEPIFTGSSRDGLNRLFEETGAPFYRFGSRPEFTSPDDGICYFFAQRVKESSGIELSVPALVDAFNQLERRPGPFREMVETMDNEADPNVELYLQHQLGDMQAMVHSRSDLQRLKTIDLAILDQIVLNQELFGVEAGNYLADKLKVEKVNPKLINDSISKMRDMGIILRKARGVYLIEDRDVAILVKQGLPAELQAKVRETPLSPFTAALPAPAPPPAPSLDQYRARALHEAKQAHSAAQEAFWSHGNDLPALRREVLQATTGTPPADALDAVWAERTPAHLAVRMETIVTASPDAGALLQSLIRARFAVTKHERRVMDSAPRPANDNERPGIEL